MDKSYCIWCRSELDNPALDEQIWREHRWTCEAALVSGSVIDAPSVVRWDFRSVAPLGFRWQPKNPSQIYVFRQHDDDSSLWKITTWPLAVANDRDAQVEWSKNFVRHWLAEGEEKRANEQKRLEREARFKHPARDYLRTMGKTVAMIKGIPPTTAQTLIEEAVGDMSPDKVTAEAQILQAVELLIGQGDAPDLQVEEPLPAPTEAPKPSTRKAKPLPSGQDSIFDML